MMQALAAGGVPILTDSIRQADADNPRGYLEFEPVKRIKSDRSWLDQASGKAVKIIHLLLMDLPADREFRVIFMHRDLREVVRSQAAMLERSGKSGASMPVDRLMAVFQGQLAQVDAWLKVQRNIRVLDVEYSLMLASPDSEAQRIAAFAGLELDINAMAAVVDPALYRNRV